MIKSFQRLNVIVHGLQWSGSSAVLDLLREYDQTVVVPNEFDEFRRIGMVADTLEGFQRDDTPPSILTEYVKYKDKEIGSIFAFYFKIYNIKTILKFGSVYRWKYKRIQLNYLKNLISRFKSVHSQSERVEVAKLWIREIGDLYSRNIQKIVVFDHGIDRFQHQDLWPVIFDPFKLIIVYRDPRDQLANLIKKGHLFREFGFPKPSNKKSYTTHGDGIQTLYGRDRKAAFQLFIDTLNNKYKAVELIHKKHGEDRILLISFEELVKKYSKSIIKIEEFLELNKVHHTNPFKFFKPEKSKKNIGYYNEILTGDEVKQFDELVDYYDRLNQLSP